MSGGGRVGWGGVGCAHAVGPGFLLCHAAWQSNLRGQPLMVTTCRPAARGWHSWPWIQPGPCVCQRGGASETDARGRRCPPAVPCRDDGVGLAAPQVGVNVRLMVFNEAGEKGKGEEVRRIPGCRVWRARCPRHRQPSKHGFPAWCPPHISSGECWTGQQWPHLARERDCFLARHACVYAAEC